jgi:archaellum component FlaG (FlaF/FlaG flagellin family)
VETFRAGDTGVTVTHTSFVLADGSSIPLRSITVLTRDGDTWKTVVNAVQVVVPNELIGPGSPLAVASASA